MATKSSLHNLLLHQFYIFIEISCEIRLALGYAVQTAMHNDFPFTVPILKTFFLIQIHA